MKAVAKHLQALPLEERDLLRFLIQVARFDFVDVAGSDNTHMLMRAMDAIPEGSEILQSYFPLNTPLPERRQRTVEIYGFACDCARCAFEAQQGDAAPSDKMDADGDEEEEEEEEESEWETDDDEDLVGEGTDAIHAKEGDDDFESQLSIYILKNLCPHAHCNGGHGREDSAEEVMVVVKVAVKVKEGVKVEMQVTGVAVTAVAAEAVEGLVKVGAKGD
eukprot:gene1104-1657_t